MYYANTFTPTKAAIAIVAVVVSTLLTVLTLSPSVKAQQAPAANIWEVTTAAPVATPILPNSSDGTITITNDGPNTVDVKYHESTPPYAEKIVPLAPHNTTRAEYHGANGVTINARSNGEGGFYKAGGTWY